MVMDCKVASRDMDKDSGLTICWLTDISEDFGLAPQVANNKSDNGLV